MTSRQTYNNMKKIISVLPILLFAVIPYVSKIYAQTNEPTADNTHKMPITQQQITGGAENNRITNLKNRADNEIIRRIDALNKINTRLTVIKHLTDAQKSSFSSQIATEIANLTTLKTKIDADTDLTTLKADVQSIITSYRVFALFIPQIQIVAAADRILNISETMKNLTTKLATRINDAKNAGKDVSGLQSLLTDMQNKIADAQTQANNVISTVAGLLPSGYPGNKSDLQSGRKMLQTARLDLVTAGQDAKKIIMGLRELKEGKIISGTPSASPTPTLPVAITPSPTI